MYKVKTEEHNDKLVALHKGNKKAAPFTKEYIHSSTPALYYMPCGHTRLSKPNDMLYRTITKCMDCSKKERNEKFSKATRHTTEDHNLALLALHKGNKKDAPFTKEYIHSKTPALYYMPCGHTRSSLPNSMLSKTITKCLDCSKHTTEKHNAKLVALHKGNKKAAPFTKEYIHSSTPALYYMPCGHTRLETPGRMRRGYITECFDCARKSGNKKRTKTLEWHYSIFVALHGKKNAPVVLSYKGHNETAKYKMVCGHIVNTMPANMINNRFTKCRKCATADRFSTELKEHNAKLIDMHGKNNSPAAREYKGSEVAVIYDMKCGDGHTRLETPHKMSNKRDMVTRCFDCCKESMRESKRKTLEEHNESLLAIHGKENSPQARQYKGKYEKAVYDMKCGDGHTREDTPSNMLNKRKKITKCLQCTTSGPDSETKFLYIFVYAIHGKIVAYKIGISKNLKQRKKSIKTGLQKGKLTLYKVFKFHLYEYCKQAERDIKKLIRAPKSVCKNFGDGQTEVYAVDQLKPAMKIIRKCRKEHLCFDYTD